MHQVHENLSCPSLIGCSYHRRPTHLTFPIPRPTLPTPRWPAIHDEKQKLRPSLTPLPGKRKNWVARLTRGVLSKLVFGVVFWGCDVVLGGARQRILLIEYSPARFAVHKSRNKGLISVDRRTSLLSHVQYPVPSESSTKDLSLSVPERRLNVVLGRSLSLRVNTESGNIVAFQHGF